MTQLYSQHSIMLLDHSLDLNLSRVSGRSALIIFSFWSNAFPAPTHFLQTFHHLECPRY